MHISILSAKDALHQLVGSWLSLQSRCSQQSDNSNHYLCLADHLESNPDSELLVLCVHDGDPAEELHGLCVLEHQRHWVASRQTLANWISKPGVDSTPLFASEQRFSAVDTILRELPTHHASPNLNLRHLIPNSPAVAALQAVCEQNHLPIQSADERRAALCELVISLQASKVKTSTQPMAHQFNSLRSLP